MQWLHGEPSLDDVLSDPVVHAVMRRDGIDAEVLRVFLNDIRRARAAAQRVAEAAPGGHPHAA